MNKKQLGPCITFLPQPTTLVTARGADGHAGLMTASWVALVSKTPPTIAVALHRQRSTCTLLREGGDFVVNVVPSSLAVAADFCGLVSSRDLDKAAQAGLTLSKAHKVASPLIEECPLNVECRLTCELPLGDYCLMVGEILEVHLAADAVGEDGRIDARVLDPLVFLGGIREYWSLGHKVADAYQAGRALMSKSEAKRG